MPKSFGQSNGINGAPCIHSLFSNGQPKLSVEISIPKLKPIKKRNKSTESKFRRPVVVTALIDTGASISCINNSLVSLLGLEPVSEEKALGPFSKNKPVKLRLYKLNLRFKVGKTDHKIKSVSMLGCDLPIITGDNICALIGRDLLKNTIFNYNGILKEYTLAFL